MSQQANHMVIDTACVDAALAETSRFFRGMPTVLAALDFFKQELKASQRLQGTRSDAPAATAVICKLFVEVDTSQVDAALAKAEQLKQALTLLSSLPASAVLTS